MQRAAIITILVLLIVSSCKDLSDEKVLAEVYGNKLYEKEIGRLINENTTTEDSAFIVKEYINSWIARQVILYEAKSLLTEEERDKKRELENYKNDLLAYEVLNKLAIQKIDSNFTEAELIAYYSNNIDEFELAENIVKIMFFKVPGDLPEVSDLWLGFKRGEDETYLALSEIVKIEGTGYTDTSSWIFFDDILKEIPINTYNQAHFLNNNKFIRINEGSFVYFVKIHDFRIKSGNSPFDLEKERIRKILFVQKQQETLSEIETELVRNAYNNNKIIIH